MRIIYHGKILCSPPDEGPTRDEDYNYDNLSVNLDDVNNAVYSLRGLIADTEGKMASLTSFSSDSTDIDLSSFSSATDCASGDANHTGFMGSLKKALEQAINVRNAILVAQGVDPDLYNQQEEDWFNEFGNAFGEYSYDILESLLSGLGGGEEEIPEICNSWFGVQNQDAWDYLKGLFDGLGKNSEERTEHKKEGDFATVYDNGNDYRVGKNLPYNFSIFYWSLGKDSGSMMSDKKDLGAGFTGSYEGMYYNADASARAGRGYVGADASFEAGIFHGEVDYDHTFWEGADGQELLGVHGSAEVSVVDVYAKGRVGMGVYTDEMGQKHTEMGVQAKVGVDLVKAEASASVNVLGAEATVSAAAKIGVGAQFDVGYVDGEFQFHVGVAAGVGFEVSGSINVGGLFENAVNWLGSLFG